MQIMVCLASVYGAWTIRDRKWYFEVEKTRGGRMFYLQDDCTHEELVEMVVNDYMLQVNGELLELSYPLPAAMMEKLPTDSPPMYVTNDRQVGSLVSYVRSMWSVFASRPALVWEGTTTNQYMSVSKKI
ncbi:unnamed protein product [Microthlaspi erraticum]|uniref:Uncharacterized protein n=1 Tax=Microthlaspi erraticum TaxID=1685480 RepID=A0A6D2J392_9BRAS|nr:unnamed protein product [Microthlaspi erraticum]